MTTIALNATYLPRMGSQYPHASAYLVKATDGALLEFPADTIMRRLLKTQRFSEWQAVFFIERKEGTIIACFPKGTSAFARGEFLKALAVHKKTKVLAP